MRPARILLAACLLAAPAAADLHVEMELASRGAGQEEKGVQRLWIKKDRLTLQDPKGRLQIFRYDRKVLWQIDPAAKLYREVPFEEIYRQHERRWKSVEERRKEIEAALARPGLSEEQKAELKSLLDGVTPRFALQAGAPEKVAGHECARFTVLSGGKKHMEVLAAAGLDSGEYRKMVELISPPHPSFAAEFAKIQGVWLRWELEIAGLGVRQTAVATRVSTNEVEERVFELPEGLKKVERK